MQAAAIDILIGVARSGKTARLLGEYRRALAAGCRGGEPARTLWLSPTNRARQCVLHALVDDSFTACLAPNVFTFDAFAERILASSPEPIAQLTDVGQRALVRRLLAECLSAGKLGYFAPIVHTSGLLDVVIGFIAELKRDEVWPEHFLKACQARGLDARDRELALIYQRYQDHLQQNGLYDSAGRFWSARNLLRTAGRPAFQELSLVAIDGFTDFTETQYEILASLAGRSERMMISLPLEPSPERYDLFAKSRRALQRLEQMSEFGHRVKIHACRRTAPTLLPAVDHIADHLFGNPRTISRLPEAPEIEIVAVTGQLGEVRMLARQVKALLQSGEEAGQIVVAFRSLRDYAELVDEVFSAAGIAFWCEVGEPLVRAPMVKAISSLLWLQAEDWPFERLMAVLRSNYVRPGWSSWQNGEGPRRLAAALRRLRVDSGRESMMAALRNVAKATGEASGGSPSDSPDGGKTAAAANALRLLEDLDSAMARLSGPAPFAVWVERLTGLVRELGMAPPGPQENGGANEQLDRRDRRHWEYLEGVLFEAAAANATFDGQPPQLTLDQFLEQFTELITPQWIFPIERDTDRVLVLEAAQVRNLDVDFLLLAGLTESSFPSNRGEGCLYGELELQRLNEHGLQMGLKSTHQQDELLMFSMIVTRPRRKLVLSYPAVSSSGQPLFPSPYLKAIQDLFELGSIESRTETDLDPVPPRDALFSMGDLRLVATAELGLRRPELFRSMCAQPETAVAAESVLRAVDAAAARFHTRGFTPFEGLVRNPSLLRQLQQRYPAGHQYSATQLEEYAVCPFRYFVSNVLNIEPTDSPTAATDLPGRGSLVHGVLASIHRQLADPEFAETGISAQELVARFRKHVDDKLGGHAAASQLQSALMRIERELLHEWAAAYGSQWEAYQSEFSKIWEEPPRPRLLEARFGQVPDEPDDADSAAFPPIELGAGKRKTLVRGRIDRIDIGRFGGESVFNLIDYKTGKPPRFTLQDVESGRALQLALYTLAVCRLELAGPAARPFQLGYWAVRETGFVGGLKGTAGRRLNALDTAVLKSLEAALDELVPRLAEHIRGGDFPVFSQDPDCTGRCPLHTICRVNQTRPLETILDKRFEI